MSGAVKNSLPAEKFGIYLVKMERTILLLVSLCYTGLDFTSFLSGTRVLERAIPYRGIGYTNRSSRNGVKPLISLVTTSLKQ